MDVAFLPSPILAFALLLLPFSPFQGAHGEIGVNYGTVADNLPPPSTVANFLIESTIINRIRLFDASPDILQAFAGSGISVTVTVPNDKIPHLTNITSAQQWIQTNIQTHLPQTNIIRILVGNEVLSTANKLLIATLVPAMENLHRALVELAMADQIKVSTPHSLGILSTSAPPSTGKFRQGYDTHVLKPMLAFLRATDSPFMINPYPFFGCSADTLDYALFRPNSGVFDQNTRLLYTNMLDAQLDAVFSAMKLLGFDDVDIVIAETGWPSEGDQDQLGVDPKSASDYNGNLIDHVTSGLGTPLMPNRTFEAYIFALFNENLKPGPFSERNFGLFEPNMTPVYDVGILRTTAKMADSPTPMHEPDGSGWLKWCLPRREAETWALQRNIDYVCGLGFDCSPIRENGWCFIPDEVRAHAAFAMNAYFQAMGGNEYDCDFEQTGAVSSVDPSYGNCKY